MTSKLTRDQLRERAQLKAKNLTYAISQSAFAGVRSELEEELQFLQCALACLEGVNSEPVAKVEAVGVCWYADNGLPRKPAVGTELFSTPSAPVCIPTFEEWCERTEQKPVGWVRDAMKEAYDACRATMLQASPVCTCPSGNGSLRWPCPVHPGSSPAIPDGSEHCPCCGKKLRRTCSVEGCGGKHVAHGLCQKHYDMQRWEDPEQVERFREAGRRYRGKKKSTVATPQEPKP